MIVPVVVVVAVIVVRAIRSTDEHATARNASRYGEPDKTVHRKKSAVAPRPNAELLVVA
jgi:hypothetical protein